MEIALCMLGVACNHSSRVRFAFPTQIHAYFKYVFACGESNFSHQARALEFKGEIK